MKRMDRGGGAIDAALLLRYLEAQLAKLRWENDSELHEAVLRQRQGAAQTLSDLLKNLQALLR